MSRRPYQQEGLDATVQALREGDRHLLIVWPTSAGKTVYLSALPEVLKLQPGEKMLILVHLQTLVWQTYEKITHYNPHLKVAIEKAEHIADQDADIVIASVQTIGRNKKREDGTWEWSDRIKQFDPDKYRYVILDECLTGDSLVLTHQGEVRIDSEDIVGKLALSYNEDRGTWEWKKILRRIPQGVRRTIRVRTDAGTIRCTVEHPIFTQRGWVKAGELTTRDLVLRPASVDVEPLSHYTDTGELYESLSVDTVTGSRSLPLRPNDDENKLTNFSPHYRSAHAAAGNDAPLHNGCTTSSLQTRYYQRSSAIRRYLRTAKVLGSKSAFRNLTLSFHRALAVADKDCTFQRSLYLKAPTQPEPILEIANTDPSANRRLLLPSGIGRSRSEPEQQISACSDHHFARADAESHCQSQNGQSLNRKYYFGGQGTRTSTIATGGPKNTNTPKRMASLISRQISRAWCTGHSWGTHQSDSQTSVVTTQDSRQPTGLYKKSGANTRRSDLPVWVQKLRLRPMRGMVTTPALWSHPVIQPCDQCSTRYALMGTKSRSLGNGWIRYRTRDLHGGTWTTDLLHIHPPVGRRFRFTPKGTWPENKLLSLGGCEAEDLTPPSDHSLNGENTSTTCTWTHGIPSDSSTNSDSTQPRLWRTSFSRVLDIEESGSHEVFDIEVEDNHNFVANGLLVHNCHHAAASPLYHGILTFFRVFKPEPENDDPNKVLIGVTATPSRTDNIGLEHLFDRIAHSRDLRDLMEDGIKINGRFHSYICEPKGYRVNTLVDLSDVKIQRGDFQVKQLEKTVNTPERNDLIVRKYLELGEGKKGVAFTVDVQHSHDLAKAFNDAGIRSFVVTGSTPEKDRKKLFSLFRSGYYRVAVSCQALIEGFDEPSAVVGLMARPTKSSLLYRQSIGRVLRPYPAPEQVKALAEQGKQPDWIKEYAIVLDFCDLSGRHSLQCMPTLFGLKPAFDLKGKKALKAVQEMERVISQKKLSLTTADVDSVEALKAIAESVDLFQKPTIPDAVKQHSELAWVNGGQNAFQLCLPDYVVLKIAQNTLGQWEVYRSVKGVRSTVGVFPTVEQAFHVADRQVPVESRIAVSANAMWRNQEPTDKQLDLAAKVLRSMRQGFPNSESFKVALKQKYTRGELSSLISTAVGQRGGYYARR